jgi:hypothetical protein
MFTIRTDGKQKPGYTVSYVEKAVIFRSRSLENIEYAKENLVWQWDKNAKDVTVGTHVFLKDTSTQALWDIGEVIDISDRDPIAWPDGWPL